MHTYTIHYRLRSGKTGRTTVTEISPFAAVINWLHSQGLTFRDVAGVLARTAR